MADKKVVIPDDLGNNFELNNKKWRVKLGKGLAPNSSGAIAIDNNTIGEAIAEAIANAPGTGMGLNKDGKLAVLRSPDAGNLLEVRENGVYYGVVAQQVNWYVDSFLGNDDNKGTKAAPLKTLHGLHKKLKNGTYTYNIYLKEGGTYPVIDTDTNEYTYLFDHLTAVTSISIRPYGDIYDDVLNSQTQRDGNGGHYNPYAIKVLQRPTIQFGNYDTLLSSGIHSVRAACLFTGSINDILLMGIKLDYIGNTFPADYDHLTIPSFRCEKIRFQGCVFNFTRRPTNVGSFPVTYNTVNVSFLNCAVLNPQNNQSHTYVSSAYNMTTIYLYDPAGKATTGGANGTTAYEIYSNANDFIPYLNIDDGGTKFNTLYGGSRINYIINRDDV